MQDFKDIQVLLYDVQGQLSFDFDDSRLSIGQRGYCKSGKEFKV